MEKDNKELKNFAIFKGIIELIDFILLFYFLNQEYTILKFAVILLVGITIIPNFRYRLKSIKEYFKANLTAVVVYLVASFAVALTVSYFGSEYDAAAVIIIPLIFNFAYIPAFFVVSFIGDVIFFKFINKNNK